MWWYMPLASAMGKERQDLCEIYVRPCHKKKEKEKPNKQKKVPTGPELIYGIKVK